MKNLTTNAVLWFSVFFLAFEAPFATMFGQGLKLWMLSVLAAGLILSRDLLKNGLAQVRQSKILPWGLGFIAFSLLGLMNSPQIGYSLKQAVVLAGLVVLAIFFEVYGSKKPKIFYSALAAGIFLSAAAAIYQNIAFEFGWPHFEAMAARPNAFFPEADWLGIYLALGSVPFLTFVGTCRRHVRERGTAAFLQNKYFFYLFLIVSTIAIMLTVARASWLALLAEMGIITIISVYSTFKKSGYELLKTGLTFLSLIIFSFIIINLFHLSRFNIPDRFRSIFFREHIITVAENPATGENFKINLEEIENYRAQGFLIKEGYVADENVASRGERAIGAWDTIKSHPLLGSGLGITLINTNFEHNANNLFLEWWASAGIGGLALMIGLLGYLLTKGFLLLKNDPRSAMIIIAGTAGFIIVNLFNAAIFLAFAWFYLAWLLITIKLAKF